MFSTVSKLRGLKGLRYQFCLPLTSRTDPAIGDGIEMLVKQAVSHYCGVELMTFGKTERFSCLYHFSILLLIYLVFTTTTAMCLFG